MLRVLRGRRRRLRRGRRVGRLARGTESNRRGADRARQDIERLEFVCGDLAPRRVHGHRRSDTLVLGALGRRVGFVVRSDERLIGPPILQIRELGRAAERA